MAVTVNWDDMDQTILLCLFEGRWSWDELHAAVMEAMHLLDGQDHPVDFILDMEQARGIPMNGMAQMSRFSGVTHPHMRLRVIVGGGGMLVSLLNTFIKLY